MSAEERKKGACSMIYFAITAAVFTLDFFLKKYIDKKYARKVKNPRLGGIICIEKFYNKGATLNLLAKHPKAMTAIHSVIMAFGCCGGHLLFCNADDWKRAHKNRTCHVSRRRTEQFI